jgi:hypothetical protein
MDHLQHRCSSEFIKNFGKKLSGKLRLQVILEVIPKSRGTDVERQARERTPSNA